MGFAFSPYYMGIYHSSKDLYSPLINSVEGSKYIGDC